jgi:hypothetical protein
MFYLSKNMIRAAAKLTVSQLELEELAIAVPVGLEIITHSLIEAKSRVHIIFHHHMPLIMT